MVNVFDVQHIHGKIVSLAELWTQYCQKDQVKFSAEEKKKFQTIDWSAIDDLDLDIRKEAMEYAAHDSHYLLKIAFE